MEFKEPIEEHMKEECVDVWKQFDALSQGINIYDLYGYCFPTDEHKLKGEHVVGYAKVGNELKPYRKFATF